MDDLKIVYLPVGALTPYERNARKHGSEDVAAIARSIEQFGFDDPIGVWGEKNVIVEGHGRLEAAKKLGMATVPCVRLDHLSDEQRRAYALAHNKTAELSGWDFGTLEEELDALLAEFDMTSLGFEAHESGTKAADFFGREQLDGDATDGEGEEYADFVDNFKPKKTTDDCYTPANIYDAVADWVSNEYGADRSCFVRPFYPGGDYRA